MLIIDYVSCIISICYARLFNGWVTLGKSFNILIIVLRVRARVFRMACLSTSSPLPSLAVKPLVTLAFFQVERKPLFFVPESLACVVSLLEEQSFSSALLSQLIAVSLGSDATCLGQSQPPMELALVYCHGCLFQLYTSSLCSAPHIIGGTIAVSS